LWELNSQPCSTTEPSRRERFKHGDLTEKNLKGASAEGFRVFNLSSQSFTLQQALKAGLTFLLMVENLLVASSLILFFE
jgi:hypothetical protein